MTNRLNRSDEGEDEGVSWRLDTNRDGKVTARDALSVINQLAEEVMRARGRFTTVCTECTEYRG